MVPIHRARSHLQVKFVLRLLITAYFPRENVNAFVIPSRVIRSTPNLQAPIGSTSGGCNVRNLHLKKGAALWAINEKEKNNVFGDWFQSLPKPMTAFLSKPGESTAPPTPLVPQYETVVIDRDFRLAALFLGAGLLLDPIPYVQILLGLPVTLLGLLFLVQTFRIRFRFTSDNNFQVVTVSNWLTGAVDEEEETAGVGENVVVGGLNSWACSSFVNYDFFPQGWIDDQDNNWVGPLLVYFKETQTDPSTWNQGPGQQANDPAKIEAGLARAGQVHFFPCIANALQLRQEFERRGCAKI